MKSVIYKEYILSVKENNGIEVYRIFDNVKSSLREAAESQGFEYDKAWTTRQFGSKLIKQFGENKIAYIGDFVITERENGSIETYRTYENTKAALREISEDSGFAYDKSWTTRQLGSNLIEYLSKL